MKIFYINVIEQNAGWGAECFINRGFIHNGVQTLTLDYRVHRHELAKQFLDAEDFDVLFLQRGDGFPLELLKAVRRPRVFWASELVARCRDQDRLLTSGLFDHIYVHSTACKAAIVQKGWQAEDKVSVLLNGFDATVQYKDPKQVKDIDVLFVGNILPRRRAWLDAIQQHYNVKECQAFGPAMTELVNRAKIVLNIHAEEYPDTETRIFEVLGCGSFVLSEKLSPESPFQSGVHLIEVDSLPEMLEKIGFYLEHDGAREQIALAGYEEAMAKHTYTQRAAQIAEQFSALPRPQKVWAMNINAVKVYAWRQSVYQGLKNIKRSLVAGR